MRKALTMSLAIIIEASLFVLADLITRRRRRNGNSNGLDRGHSGCLAAELRAQPIGAAHSLHPWRGMRHAHRHRPSIS